MPLYIVATIGVPLSSPEFKAHAAAAFERVCKHERLKMAGLVRYRKDGHASVAEADLEKIDDAQP